MNLITKLGVLALFAMLLCGLYLTTDSFNVESVYGIATTQNSATPDVSGSKDLKSQNSTYCSVSPIPDPRLFVQPNGDNFEAYIRELNHVIYLETTDGYTIMQDPADGVYRFVSRGTKGDLALTRLAVTSINERSNTALTLLQALPKHLRYEGDKLARLQSSNTFRGSNDDGGGNTINAVFPPTGVQRALLLLIDYPDQPHVYSVAEFENLANQDGYSVNGASGSFREYFIDISGGQLLIDTDVFGWYTAQNNRATYGVQDLNNRDFNPARSLVREAVDAAEAAGVDFSQYDGDNDGRVDVVEIIHSGRGTEESGNPDDIWSHRSGLGGLSVTYDGKVVNDYIMQAEKLGATNICNIGVLVHEFGHALGLPDLYDTNGGSAGIGRWCLMAGGTWNHNGRTPAHPSAWCKEQLGWMNPVELTGEGSIADMAVSQSNTESYRINVDGSSQYFLLENRLKTGWDTYIPGNGLMIYHIDPSQNSNANENHRRVDIEQADGDLDLNVGSGGNNGDNGDTYPGSSNNTAFNCGSNPNSNLYGGGNSNINISNITRQSDLISFDYGFCSVECLIGNISLDGEPSEVQSGTYDQRFIISYAFPPASGMLNVTVGSAMLSVAITGSPQTVAFTGLPANGEQVTVSAFFSAEPDCELTRTDLYTAPLDCNNDDICDALDITAEIGRNEVICNNIGATTQANEPKPNSVSCNNQSSWCDNAITNTVWFKFTAPASGSIDIDFVSANDLQLAVWESNGDCASILSSNALLVAANDDGGSGGGFSPRINNLSCLVPGKVYYVQVDGYNGRQAIFRMNITDPGLSCNVAPTSTDGCNQSVTTLSEGNGTWLHLTDANGERIASVNDQFNNLGQISLAYNANTGELQTDADGYPLMNRDWQITVQNNNAASVRLYLSESEYQGFVDAGGAVDLIQCSLLKISGANCGEASGGTSVVQQSVASKMDFDRDNHMVEFEVAGFSNFFLRSESAILPIEMQYFTGKVTGKTNLLEWGSATEENTFIHEIERLVAGEDEWKVVGEIPAAGFSQELLAYEWEDHYPAPLAYYRIKTIDFDESFQYSELINLERKEEGPYISRVFPNPATTALFAEVYVPESTEINWSLVNMNGQRIAEQNYQANKGLEQLRVDLSGQPTGLYFLHIRIGEQLLVRKVIKE